MRHLRVDKRSSKHKAHDTRNTKRKLDKTDCDFTEATQVQSWTKGRRITKWPNECTVAKDYAALPRGALVRCSLSFAECQICCPRVVRLFFSSETLEPNFNDILKNNTDRQFRSDCRIMLMSATRNTKELTNKWAVSWKISAPRSPIVWIKP